MENFTKIDDSLKSKVKTELKINLKSSTGKWINIESMTNKLFYSKILQSIYSPNEQYSPNEPLWPI